MDDLRTQALLVGFDRAGAVGTVVPRAEIAEAAAGTEFPATLHLDLDKIDGDDATTRARVAVDWDQESLEQLLASTEDQDVELWFDARELAMAFDDVEGHGLRERVAVLTVAIAAVGATSSPAFARLATDSGAAGGVVATSVSVNPQAGVPSVPVGGAERALIQDEKLSQGVTAGTAQAGLPSVPIGGAERALAQDEKLTQGLSTSKPAATGVSVNPQTGVPAVPVGGAERALVQDEKVSQGLSTSTGQTSATSSSSGTTLSSGELAGVVAGGVLLIAAAGFGATHRRTPPVQPA